MQDTKKTMKDGAFMAGGVEDGAFMAGGIEDWAFMTSALLNLCYYLTFTVNK